MSKERPIEIVRLTGDSPKRHRLDEGRRIIGNYFRNFTTQDQKSLLQKATVELFGRQGIEQIADLICTPLIHKPLGNPPKSIFDRVQDYYAVRLSPKQRERGAILFHTHPPMDRGVCRSYLGLLDVALRDVETILRQRTLVDTTAEDLRKAQKELEGYKRTIENRLDAYNQAVKRLETVESEFIASRQQLDTVEAEASRLQVLPASFCQKSEVFVKAQEAFDRTQRAREKALEEAKNSFVALLWAPQEKEVAADSKKKATAPSESAQTQTGEREEIRRRIIGKGTDRRYEALAKALEDQKQTAAVFDDKDLRDLVVEAWKVSTSLKERELQVSLQAATAASTDVSDSLSSTVQICSRNLDDYRAKNTSLPDFAPGLYRISGLQAATREGLGLLQQQISEDDFIVSVYGGIGEEDGSISLQQAKGASSPGAQLLRRGREAVEVYARVARLDELITRSVVPALLETIKEQRNLLQSTTEEPLVAIDNVARRAKISFLVAMETLRRERDSQVGSDQFPIIDVVAQEIRNQLLSRRKRERKQKRARQS